MYIWQTVCEVYVYARKMKKLLPSDAIIKPYDRNRISSFPYVCEQVKYGYIYRGILPWNVILICVQ